MPFFRRGRVQLKRTMFNSFGSGGPLPPDLFSGTYAFYPFGIDAQNKVANGYGYNDGLSPKNFVTTSGIETAETGSIAVSTKHAVTLNGVTRGVQGALVEPSATNYIILTDDVEDANVWPIEGAGTATNGLDKEINVSIDLSETSFRLYQIEPPHTGMLCVSVFVKAASGESGDYILSVQETSNVNRSELTFIDDTKWTRVSVTGEFFGRSAVSAYFARGDRGQTLSNFKFKYPQLELDTVTPSSPIYNPNTTPATRDQDKAYVQTSDVFIDDARTATVPCTLGDQNREVGSGAYVGGLFISSSGFADVASFDGLTSDIDGKYLDLVSSKMIGAIVTSDLNGAKAVITDNLNSSTFRFVRLSDNEDIVAGFAYPNKLTIDWSSSDYTRAEVEQLRNDVGDTPKAKVKSVRVDDGCFLGNFKSSIYDKGVAIQPDFRNTAAITFLGGGQSTSDISGKYIEKVTSEWVGGTYGGYEIIDTQNDKTFTITGLSALTNSELRDLLGYPSKAEIVFPDTYPEQELIDLRESVGDTEADWGDLPIWLNWPSENVVFEFDFTLLSDDANELFHIEWANAAKDTYIARTANVLEFNHGNDELSVPYAALIQTKQTYKGEVIITPTELIGRVEGVADVSITRTDTQLAEWENQCWFGGFEETLSPLIVGDFKVKDYVITPPPNGLVVVDGETLTGQAGSSAYYTGSATFGSLTPPVVVGADTIGFIYTLNEPSFGGKITDIGNDDGITGTSDLLLSFDGQEFRAVYGNGGWRVVSDVLYDYLQSKWNTPINFTAEIAPPSGSRLKVVEADAVLGGSNTTAYLSATAAGQEYGQLIPPVVIDGMAITFLYTLNDGNDIVVIGNDFDGYPPLKCTFDGQEFILNTVPETPTPALVALLNDAKDAGREIDFTAEIASDFADNGDFANNGDFA